MKALAKRILWSYRRKLVWVPPDEVTGFDLGQDLGTLISTQAPICFDVGANEGQTIELLLNNLKFPQIHAFEPVEEISKRLQSAYGRRGVTVNQMGLGRESGNRSLKKYNMSVLNSYLDFDDATENRFREREPVAVENTVVGTVDGYCEVNQIPRVHLLKIDTQGLDGEVLMGAERMLSRQAVDFVMIELNYAPMYKGEMGAWAIGQSLHERGYRLISNYEVFRQADQTTAWTTALFRRVSLSGQGSQPQT